MMEQFYEHRASNGTAGVLEWSRNIKQTDWLTDHIAIALQWLSMCY